MSSSSSLNAQAGPSRLRGADHATPLESRAAPSLARLEDDEAFENENELPAPLDLPPADMLDRYETVNVLAPLVRCSKLPFRHLCSLYETQMTHTPMILAEEFSRSQTARISDFSTSVLERGVFWMEPRPGKGSNSTSKACDAHSSNFDCGWGRRRRPSVENENGNGDGNGERGGRGRLPPTLSPPTPRSELVRGRLLAQLASPNAASLADASELISPYVDGIDINCGCPQKWAYHEGIGCALLRKPELVADMIRVTKDRLGWGYPVSIKIRIDPEQPYVPVIFPAGPYHPSVRPAGITDCEWSTVDC